MLKYFDEDFFKFLLGFIAIVAISLVILLATRMYASTPKTPNESVSGIGSA